MSHKGDWSRVNDHKAYQDNYDRIFKRTLRHNGVGEGDMYSDEELKAELYPNQNNTMPIDEDLRRYTAPPDNDPEPPVFNGSEILEYLHSWLPAHPADCYEIHEIQEILRNAANGILDEEYGIKQNH